MNSFIQVAFTNIQPEQQELLIAHLSDAGYEGFEQGDTSLKAFVPETNYDDSLISGISFKYRLSYKVMVIPEQNWNTVWEANFQPVIVNDFAGIRAHFHPAIENVEHEIIITPKMSFGTGHHATTAMMILQMKKLEFTGKTVFDFGTGTGVLAILAKKCGAAEVLAMDHDEWSISNAAENIRVNNSTGIRLLLADAPEASGTFDIILANLNRNVILDHFEKLVEQLSQNGHILLSGMLVGDREEIVSVARQYALRCVDEISRDQWLCLQFSY